MTGTAVTLSFDFSKRQFHLMMNTYNHKIKSKIKNTCYDNQITINMDMQAKSKWSCIRCGVVIPYNPQYDMSNTLCSNCATYQNADKLLGGYRSDKKKN
jgi:hypothetical protein